MKYRMIFLGTPYFAAEILGALSAANFDIVGVISQPDKKSGRGGKIVPSETKLLAGKLSLPLYQPKNADELHATVERLKPDLAIVAAYGKIIPQKTIDIPKFGFLNVHGSLLPRFRGSSCIPQAIIHGDKETGISIMKLAFQMDAGPVLSQVKIPITDQDTTATLTEKLAEIGAKEIIRVIPLWLEGKIEPKVQCLDTMVMCQLTRKEDALIDWQETAETILRKIRAYNPWPIAYTKFDDETLRIISAKPNQQNLLPGRILASGNQLIVGTSRDSIEIKELQLAGKKVVSAREFINGHKDSLRGNKTLG